MVLMPMSREEMDAFLARAEERDRGDRQPGRVSPADADLVPLGGRDGLLQHDGAAPRNLERDGRVSICVDEPGDPDQRTVVLAAESCTITPGLGTVTETIARKYGGDNWESSYEHIANTPERVVVSCADPRPDLELSADRRVHVQKNRWRSVAGDGGRQPHGQARGVEARRMRVHRAMTHPRARTGGCHGIS